MQEKKNTSSKSKHNQMLKVNRLRKLEEKMRINMKKRKQNIKKI